MLCESLSLDQLLADPLIRLVMRSDNVGEDDVRSAMRHARRGDPASIARRPGVSVALP